MFINNSRFQIAAICFLIIILYDYIKNRKIPLLSTRFFSLLLFFSIVNIIADITTVYTITHMDTVPAWFNKLAHQIFIGSLDSVIVSLYFYVSILGKNQKRLSSLHVFLRLIPYITAMAMVVLTPLYYHNDGKTIYSYGAMVITLYIVIAFYMVIIITDVLRYRITLGRSKMVAILLGVSAWVIAAIIQILFPMVLVSGLAAVLMVFFIYLSFENPKEHIDMETNLFNRRAFQLMISDIVESKKKFYIINLSLDDFNIINNNFGYDIGKELISNIGNYITYNITNWVFHIHSNCVTVYIKCSDEKLISYVEKLKSRFEQTWKLAENEITVSAHADIIECPKYASTTDDIYDTISYMAETNNNDDQFIHTINEQYLTQKKRYNNIQEIIYNAIENDGFDIAYQPIFSVDDNSFVSAEALVRLKDKTTIGFISPEEFIPIAEKSGLIMKLGEIVFRKVCQFARENCVVERGVHYIEVNLSGIQCIDYYLPDQLHKIMREYDIDPQFINLEITETAAISSGDMLHKNMRRLREIGCSFSMDDFGTGYSNLSQMADVRYDLVKIDKSLIWPCFGDNNKNPVVILQNVVNMLLQMNVKIVAEGVETEEQLDCLTKMGVDYIQGYYFSKPISETDYISFLSKHNQC